MLVTLINPTNSDLTVTIFGVEYSIPAKGKNTFPSEVAFYWVNEIHQFLEIEAEATQVVEEEPKKKTKSK